jgi:hypothetical protein
MEEIVLFQGREFRSKGREIHRRPVDRSWRSPADAAWLVLRSEEVPPAIRSHFLQAQNRAAVD